MRTAIVLLFLLALAAVPGSLLPQRSLSQNAVNQYFVDHPTLAPVLDDLFLFDVFSSPWFAAVYLLLFVSLIGCVLPRGLEHYRAMRAAPPAAPRNLLRLPDAGELPTTLPTEQALDVVEEELRVRRFRVVRRQGSCRPRRGTSRRPATCCSTSRWWRCCSASPAASCGATRAASW
ncbi:cytochrome c biogenesis protein ResB [Blastococcus brunescens]|uniref:Cytochrome c biogenesis protein ResB n=1 Tax=Blastococcus brunescens TaxID=1564165 RepID=A0ABZ1AX70_9ACTN|nr:cytochrome c biogenesis protein ResB [Blastococcus sp. BMG 8361]WRL63163.1 cytochrome c biogenesis protein ResB [Blastococcus sp. BMG 8361]